MSDSFCKNCGSILNPDGSCPYCQKTINSSSLDFKIADEFENNRYYREIECKEANLTFFNTIFPLIFAIAFGIPGVFVPLSIYLTQEQDKMILFFMIPFGLVSLGASIIFLNSIIKAIIIKLYGKDTIGTVIGYRDDNTVLYNGVPGAICEILINLNLEKVVLLYQTGGPDMPFPINSKVRVRCYKDLFKIYKTKNDYEVWNSLK